MNLTLRLGIFTVIAIFGAVYLGIGITSDQESTVGTVLGIGALIVCLALGRKVWLVLPFFMSIHLTLAIPGRPATIELAEIIVIAFIGIQMFAGRIPWKLKITELEVWAFFLLMCIVQVYIRNPVGMNILGSGNVGGRPYFMFALAFVTMVIIGFIRVPPSELKTALKVSIFGGLIHMAMNVVGYMVPSVGRFYGAGQIESTYSNEVADASRAGRLDFLSGFGSNLALWVSSFINPVKACFKVLWLPLVIFAFLSAGASGYRNVIVSTGLTFLVGIFYRGGMRWLFLSLGVAVLVLCGLAAVNTVKPLPPNVQRSLSWLPGTWSKDIKLDAQRSSDWRFEMWEEVLLTDDWISNKFLGDGLGFTAKELEYQQQISLNPGGMGLSGFDLHRETILVNGDYHSGPVSAIRTSGYLGLLILFFAQLRLVVHAHRQIMRAKNTEWWPVTLIFGIPIIWAPIFFLFVFGGFQQDVVLLLMGMAFVRLLENNLPLPPHPKQRS